jgi:hypothetical protein
MNDLNNGTDDTPQHLKPLRKEETMSKEANSQLAIRQEKFIRDLHFPCRKQNVWRL